MNARRFVKRFLAYGAVGYVAVHLVIWAALLIGALAAYRPELFSGYNTLTVVLIVLPMAGTATVAAVIRHRRSRRQSDPGESTYTEQTRVVRRLTAWISVGIDHRTLAIRAHRS